MKQTILCLLLLLLSDSQWVKAQKVQENPMFEMAINTIIGNQLWNQDSNGISGYSEPFDRLSHVLSNGDFNNDGWQDLAVGIPFHDRLLDALEDVGTVLIIYGTSDGLSANNHQYLYQPEDSSGSDLESLNGVEAFDNFGLSIASGDFNCDGFDDLAVGTPYESITLNDEIRLSVGAINVFYGSQAGLPLNGQDSTFIWQGTGVNISFEAVVSTGDRFGYSMVAGNFNGDFSNGKRCMDLAVSAPFEGFGDKGEINDGGQVEIFYGDPAGLDGANRFSLNQNVFTVNGEAEASDLFGFSLAAGTFKTDNFYSDLAVGIPGESIGGINRAGAVQIFYGSASGILKDPNDEIWSQQGGIEGVPEDNDRFGTNLTTGDFNGDQATDLAIGVPYEDLNSDNINNAGAVNIIYGSVTGLVSTDNRIFHQNTEDIIGEAEDLDRLGSALTSGNLNYDAYADLVIGVPRKNNSAGAFHVIYGGANGLATTDNVYHTTGAEEGDGMGFAMTVGDFGNGPELAVGVPGDDSVDAENDVGSVRVYGFEIPDVIFKDSFNQ